MTTMMKHMDCRNFAALDVAKGICHRTKELVLADDEQCQQFVAIQKCKFCDHYIASGEYLGVCNADSRKPITYPDLITVTCEKFVAAEAAKR